MKYDDESILTCDGMTYCSENDIKNKLDRFFGTIIIVIISISSQPCGGGNFLVVVIFSWREVTRKRNSGGEVGTGSVSFVSGAIDILSGFITLTSSAITLQLVGVSGGT
jgi:hypothetical protein